MRISDWSSDVCSSDLYTVFLRYGESPAAKEAAQAAALLDDRRRSRAVLLGAALRLSYRVSAATRWVLDHSALTVDGGVLELKLPDDGSVPRSEERRGGTERVLTCSSRWSPSH